MITLHDVLSPAEKELVKSPVGAARIREFHGHLFATSSKSLCEEVKGITGVEVREATTEAATGTVVHILRLARSLPVDFGAEALGTIYRKHNGSMAWDLVAGLWVAVPFIFSCRSGSMTKQELAGR